MKRWAIGANLALSIHQDMTEHQTKVTFPYKASPLIIVFALLLLILQLVWFLSNGQQVGRAVFFPFVHRPKLQNTCLQGTIAQLYSACRKQLVFYFISMPGLNADGMGWNSPPCVCAVGSTVCWIVPSSLSLNDNSSWKNKDRLYVCQSVVLD